MSRSDALSWRDQVESVRRKCFAGLAKLRRLDGAAISNQETNLQCASASSLRLLFCCMAGVFDGAR